MLKVEFELVYPFGLSIPLAKEDLLLKVPVSRDQSSVAKGRMAVTEGRISVTKDEAALDLRSLCCLVGSCSDLPQEYGFPGLQAARAVVLN